MSDNSDDSYTNTDELITPSDTTRRPKIFRRNRLRRLQKSDGDTDSHTTFGDEEDGQTRRQTILVCGKQVPSIVINILLSIASLILNIISIVAVPIYANSIMEIGGSLFFMNTFYGAFVTSILFLGSLAWSLYSGWPGTMVHGASWKVLFIMSQFGCANTLLINYAQDPQKTPPYLQALLSITLIPFTVLMRAVFFKRRPNIESMICILAIVVGIIIASEPRIFGFSEDDAAITKPDTSFIYRMVWPAIFACCHAPVAFINCLQEKESKQEQVSSTGFMLWIHILNQLSFWSLFWTDIIPHVGTSSSIHDFGQRYVNGLQCVFGLHPHCTSMLVAAWVTIGISFVRYVVQFLLIRYTEGAVYTSMIMSLGNPVGTIFWSFFSLYPTLHFNPRYSKATTYTLIGLVFMTPSVLIYNYLSYKEEQKAIQKKNEETEIYENFHEVTEDEIPQNNQDSETFSTSVETDGGLYNL